MKKKIAEEQAHQKLAEMRTEMEERLKQLKLKRSEVPTEAENESEVAVEGNEAADSKERSLKTMKPENLKSEKIFEKGKSEKYSIRKQIRRKKVLVILEEPIANIRRRKSSRNS